MMMLNSNKQKMYYALQIGEVPIYEYYTDSGGNKIPLETGEYKIGYGKPVEFFGNINNKLNEFVWKEYGIDNSTNFAQIVASKDVLPLKAGSVIWKKSAIKYIDNENTIVDESSADYVVKGVADEGLSEDLFLLQRNLK